MNWIASKEDLSKLEDAVWVDIVANIRKNETGEIRKYETIAVLHNGEDCPRAYIWEDGNYSCDCNRATFFEDVGGDDSETEEDHCSDGRFSVQVFNPLSDIAYYSEFK